MNFNIDFGLDISKGICYQNTNKLTNDEFDIRFFFITNGVVDIQAEINQQANSNNYNLKGVYNYIVGSPIFYPTIVIMVEPIFQNKPECNKRVRTYFIDLQKLKTEARNKEKYYGYLMKLDLGKIKLGNDNFITVSQVKDKIFIDYSDFIPTNMSNNFRHGIENWYRL